jgi:hypothetical protein
MDDKLLDKLTDDEILAKVVSTLKTLRQLHIIRSGGELKLGVNLRLYYVFGHDPCIEVSLAGADGTIQTMMICGSADMLARSAAR